MRIRWMVWVVVLLALACGAIPAVGQGGSPLRDVLLPEGCEQACYLGIRPGITTPEEARIILDNANREYEYGPMTLDPHTTFYSYAVRATGYPFAGQGTSIVINVFIDTNEIPQISIVKPVESTVEEIVSEFGQPTRIIVRNQVEIVYEDYLLSFFVSEDNQHIDSIAILSPETFDFAFNDPAIENLQPCTEPATLCDIVLASPPPATLSPTAPAVSEEATPANLRRLLSGPGCQAACVLGIEPGMTATEMEEILTGLGVEYRIDTMGLVEPLDIVYRAYVAIPDEFAGDRVGLPISISIDPDGKIAQLYVPIEVAVADMVKAFGNPTFLGQDGVSNIVGYPELGLFFLFSGVESGRTFLVLIRNSELTRAFLEFPSLVPCVEPADICGLFDSPTATPSPTAPAISEDTTPADLRRVFNDPGCETPSCWLGIEPGITTQAEVRRILAEIGVEYTVNSASYPPVGFGEENGIYNFLPSEDWPYIYTEGHYLAWVHFTDGIAGLTEIPVEIPLQQVLDEYGTPAHVMDRGGVAFLVYPVERMAFGVPFADSDTVVGVAIGTEKTVRDFFLYEDSMTTPLTDCSALGIPCPIPTATPVASSD